jgi:phosphoglycolate phosphatase-like HAD superfamily hydrolase
VAVLAGDGRRAAALIEVASSGLSGPPTQGLLAELCGVSHVVFDLDGTLYDTRDFEGPAIAAVVNWLRECTDKPLDGLQQALQARRVADRHRAGLFDDLLPVYGLPAALGAECAARFHSYPGAELSSARSLRDELNALRSGGRRLALVTNGRAILQQRKLRLLGLETMFDFCIYCDPAEPDQLKPSAWGWNQLRSWRGASPTAYVGDDPVDAQFADVGRAQFVSFAFKDPRYGN